MKLGIISDCIHYKTPEGKVGTENHIFVRQLQALCSYFDEVLICCPFAEYNAAKVISVYAHKNISFTAVPVAGGDTVKAKLQIFSTIPKWLHAYKKINSFSDIVYQRFPNNLNIPGFFYFWLKRKKVFGTYTGTWKDYKTEPSTYKFQRWLLRNYFKGPVWVYSTETNSKRILPGFSPSYSRTEWDEESEQVNNRIACLQKNGIPVFRLITVGTLIEYKNQTGIIKACIILKKKAFPFYLTIVGDGPMRTELETMIADNHLQNEIKMVGKKQYAALRALYREHDFVVQAPLSEGFGKVPVEGFFHGVIPIISNTSMANHIIGNGQRGFLFDASDENILAETILRLQQEQETLPQMIKNGRDFAKSQTLEAWAKEYYKTVTEYFA